MTAEQIQEDAEAVKEDSENDVNVLPMEGFQEVVLWYLAHFVCEGRNLKLP